MSNTCFFGCFFFNSQIWPLKILGGHPARLWVSCQGCFSVCSQMIQVNFLRISHVPCGHYAIKFILCSLWSRQPGLPKMFGYFFSSVVRFCSKTYKWKIWGGKWMPKIPLSSMFSAMMGGNCWCRESTVHIIGFIA